MLSNTEASVVDASFAFGASGTADGNGVSSTLGRLGGRVAVGAGVCVGARVGVELDGTVGSAVNVAVGKCGLLGDITGVGGFKLTAAVGPG